MDLELSEDDLALCIKSLGMSFDAAVRKLKRITNKKQRAEIVEELTTIDSAATKCRSELFDQLAKTL